MIAQWLRLRALLSQPKRPTKTMQTLRGTEWAELVQNLKNALAKPLKLGLTDPRIQSLERATANLPPHPRHHPEDLCWEVADWLFEDLKTHDIEGFVLNHRADLERTFFLQHFHYEARDLFATFIMMYLTTPAAIAKRESDLPFSVVFEIWLARHDWDLLDQLTEVRRLCQGRAG